MNLIGNAMKFAKEEGSRTRIFVEETEDQTAICVEDQGIGLDCTHADRIFEIFQRLHTEDEYEGTGVGLAICKKIVQLWGGRIWVDSVPGNGCKFYFSVEPSDSEARLPAPRVRSRRERPFRVSIGDGHGGKQQPRNISSTGVGIYFDPRSTTLTVGQQIDLRIELPSSMPINLNGIVRHVTQKSNLTSHCGVEFLALETHHLAQICQYVQHNAVI